VDASIGIGLVSLMLVFTVTTIYYQRRQATALEHMAEVNERVGVSQIKSIRREQASGINIGDPIAWLSEQASEALDEPVALVEVKRAVPELSALDVAAETGRVVFSTIEPGILRKRVEGTGRKKDTASRLERFAADTPLLGSNPRRAKTGERSIINDEWFDVKAEKAARSFDLQWDQPERIHVYRVV
jgi:hypothetical protein